MQNSETQEEDPNIYDARPRKPVRAMGLLAPLRRPGVGAWRRAGRDDDIHHAALDTDPNTDTNTNADTDADTTACGTRTGADTIEPRTSICPHAWIWSCHDAYHSLHL